MGEELFEAVEVETVFYVVDVDFAEKVVVFEIAEPGNPSALGII